MSRGSRLLALIRMLRRIPPPRIDRTEAIALATAEIRRRSWDREAEAPVFESLREWIVYADNTLPCGTIVVHVDMQDGRVSAFTKADCEDDEARPGDRCDAESGSPDDEAQ